MTKIGEWVSHPTLLLSKANKSRKSPFSMFVKNLLDFLFLILDVMQCSEKSFLIEVYNIAMGLYLPGDVVISKRQLYNLSTSLTANCL